MGKTGKKGAEYRVCLIYPNRREVGLGNLGFHKIFSAINFLPNAYCDIAFLPEDGSKPVSEENGWNLGSFDLLAFSVTFEMDALNVLEIIQRAGIPLERTKRDESHPIICAGGVAVTLNPEPLSDFFDFFVIGEGEQSIPILFDSLTIDRQNRHSEVLKKISGIPGLYVPSLYELKYRDDFSIESRTPMEGAPEKIKRLYSTSYVESGSMEEIPGAEHIFRNSFLIETGKGCGQGCRFCAAGFVYRPVRHVKIGRIKEQVAKGIDQKMRIGLIGSAICEHPDIEELLDNILEGGGKMSVSSMRVGKVNSGTFEKLARGGGRSVTIAPEAGTDRLRRAINKDMTDDEIVQTVAEAAKAGILNVKLYFLIGLPTETDEDVAGMIGLVKSIRDAFVENSKPHGRIGRIIVGVNPFVPKPQTPYQWERFAPMDGLKKKMKLIRGKLAGQSNLTLQTESVRNSAVQALLSTGSRKVGGMILDAFKRGSWSGILRKEGARYFYEKEKGKDTLLPWDFIDSTVTKEYLWKENEKSKRSETSPPCPPPRSGCRKCGLFEDFCI